MAEIHAPVPNLKLNDGNSIPMLGYGTGTAWYKSKDDGEINRQLVDSIKKAIDLGYYHLDGAEIYNTERELGEAIKESGVERGKLFVTTKVIRNIKDIQNAIKASLQKLQLDYVDLYLIHQPFFADGGKDEAALQQAWVEMEKVKEQGLAKSIGISNFLEPHINAILKTAKQAPVINQIEFHPYLQHHPLVKHCKQNGIEISAYGPQVPVTAAKGGPVDEYLSDLAKKYAVSEGDVLLRWCIDQDVAVITTSTKEQRLSDYLRVTRFKLTPEEVRRLGELGDQKHYRRFWTDKYDPEDRS